MQLVGWHEVRLGLLWGLRLHRLPVLGMQDDCNIERQQQISESGTPSCCQGARPCAACSSFKAKDDGISEARVAEAFLDGKQ